MSFIDFAELKAAHPIMDVVERLGLNLSKSGASFRGKCPVCESGGDRNLVVTPEKSLFYCFTNGKGGDVLQLVAHVKGISVKEAAEWLQGSVGPKAKEKTTKGEPSEGFQPLSYLEHDHPAVIALGIEPDDAERIGCGFAPRGLMKGTVAWPIRSTSGKLLGYIGTTEAKIPPKWNY